MKPRYEMARWSLGPGDGAEASGARGRGAAAAGTILRAERSRAQNVLEVCARWLRGRHEDYFRILGDGEPADDRLDEEIRSRLSSIDDIILSIASSLRRPVPIAQAICRALASPEIYWELVVDSGWAPEAFESWLAGSLVDELL